MGKGWGTYMARTRKFNKLIKQAKEVGEIDYDEVKKRTLQLVNDEFEKWRPHFQIANGVVVDFKLRLLDEKNNIHNIHPRHFPEYKEWRSKVFERDNFTCQQCGSKEKLEAHHKEQYVLNANKRLDIDNGITLCKTCHGKIPRRRIKNG